MLTDRDKSALNEIFAGAGGEVVDEILSNQGMYEDDLDELLNEFHYNNKLKLELSALQTRYSALNMEIYEKYMAVHSNAIVISALIAENNLKNNGNDAQVDVDTRTILDEYLFFTGFR